MNNRTLLVAAVVVIVVAGVAYALGHRNASTNGQPQGVLGNAMAGLSDSINQASNQAKADADKQSAQQHFDAAKSALGIHPDSDSSSD